MDIKAFFLTPENLIIDAPTKHISKIIDFPELFGLDKNFIVEIYTKYNEPLHFEGNAREIIISDLLEKKWLRVRIRSEKHLGTVCVFQISELNDKNLKQIKEFCYKIIIGIDGFKLVDTTLVKILDINGALLSDPWLTLKDF